MNSFLVGVVVGDLICGGQGLECVLNPDPQVVVVLHVVRGAGETLDIRPQEAIGGAVVWNAAVTVVAGHESGAAGRTDS